MYRPSANLPKRLLSGSLWSIGGEFSAGTVRALAYFLYARFLTPTDFGLLGFCILVLSLFPLILDNSLGLYLIRQKEEHQKTSNTVLLLNVSLAAVSMLLVSLAAPLAATLIHDRRIDFLLPILSAQLLCNALCATHIAIARRRFQYRILVPVRFISTLASLGVGLPLAYLGFGYWALAWAMLTASAAQMIAAWMLVPWTPTLKFDWSIVRTLASFSSWSAVDMGVTWMVMSGGGFFLAFFLGPHDLGLYRLSDQINTYTMGAVLSPLIPVFYSAFCELADDRGQWQPLFGQLSRLIALAAATPAGLLVIFARSIEATLGPKWHGIASVIALNAIADGISYFLLPLPSLLRSQGHPRTVAAVRIVMVVGQIVAYSALASHGLIAFLGAKIGLEASIYILSYLSLRWSLSMPVARVIVSQIRPALFVVGTAGLSLLLIYKINRLGTLAAAAVGLCAYVLAVGLYLGLLERRTIHTLLTFRQR